jgi:hypothetical protein
MNTSSIGFSSNKTTLRLKEKILNRFNTPVKESLVDITTTEEESSVKTVSTKTIVFITTTKTFKT